MKHVPDIHKVACSPDGKGADELLLGYGMEGIRLAGTFGTYRQAIASDVVNDNGKDVHVKAGDRVFVSFVGNSCGNGGDLD
jgi:Tfp pilus assembly protein PilP